MNPKYGLGLPNSDIFVLQSKNTGTVCGVFQGLEEVKEMIKRLKERQIEESESSEIHELNFIDTNSGESYSVSIWELNTTLWD